MNIFIVEGNEQFREALKIYITKILKFKISGEAQNGLEFLKIYRYHNDIILMDIDSPIINGKNAFKNAKAKDSRVTSIAMAFDFIDEEINDLEEMGFLACIRKKDIVPDLKGILNRLSLTIQ